jgi:hypothetical protein
MNEVLAANDGLMEDYGEQIAAVALGIAAVEPASPDEEGEILQL